MMTRAHWWYWLMVTNMKLTMEFQAGSIFMFFFSYTSNVLNSIISAHVFKLIKSTSTIFHCSNFPLLIFLVSFYNSLQYHGCAHHKVPSIFIESFNFLENFSLKPHNNHPILIMVTRGGPQYISQSWNMIGLHPIEQHLSSSGPIVFSLPPISPIFIEHAQCACWWPIFNFRLI